MLHPSTSVLDGSGLRLGVQRDVQELASSRSGAVQFRGPESQRLQSLNDAQPIHHESDISPDKQYVQKQKPGSLERADVKRKDPEEVADAIAEYRLKQCCKMNKITPYCQPLCSYKVKKDQVSRHSTHSQSFVITEDKNVKKLFSNNFL